MNVKPNIKPKTMTGLTVDDIFKIGMVYAGHDFTKPSYKEATAFDCRHFNSAYILSPEAILKIFDDLHSVDIGEHHIKNPCLKYLFMTLSWWAEYRTFNNMAGKKDRWGVTEKTIEKYVWQYTWAVEALAQTKVVWPFEEGDDMPKEIFLATVDGVHFKVYEMRQTPNKNMKSPKSGGAAVAYELAISIWNGKLVWINGPFPAGETDIVIFQKPGGLKSKIPANKRLIGDKIYLSQPEVSGRNPTHSKTVATFVERMKARHEVFNRRIKSFNILKNCFRSKTKDRLKRHKSVLTAICVAVQYDLENGKPLFDV
jgi:hypothetical protein